MKATAGITVLFVLWAAAAMAAPSLEVTKPPVGPPPTDAPSGPPQDPWAEQGQWCQDGVRTHEYYDNAFKDGGTPGGPNVIYGKVTNVTWNLFGKISTFTITATIKNPSSDPSGPWRAGYNDHYPERLITEEYYKGTLYDTVLTASFAVRGDPSAGFILPSNWNSPYTQRTPYIYATNEDMGAWYCWCPGYAPPEGADGNYYVPTWNFGDIELGDFATRDLEFAVADEGLGDADQRYDAIMKSYQSAPNAGDILLNRSTSLKLSDWIDDLCIDEGTAYPTDTWDPIIDPNGYVLYDPDRNSDVSVFHNIPEPASLLLLGVGGVGLIRSRRK